MGSVFDSYVFILQLSLIELYSIFDIKFIYPTIFIWLPYPIKLSMTLQIWLLDGLWHPISLSWGPNEIMNPKFRMRPVAIILACPLSCSKPKIAPLPRLAKRDFCSSLRIGYFSFRASVGGASSNARDARSGPNFGKNNSRRKRFLKSIECWRKFPKRPPKI